MGIGHPRARSAEASVQWLRGTGTLPGGCLQRIGSGQCMVAGRGRRCQEASGD